MNDRKIAGVKVFVSNETYDEYKGTLQEQINNLQSKIDKAIDKLNQYEIISGYYDSNYDGIEDTYPRDIKEDLLDILKEAE